MENEEKRKKRVILAKALLSVSIISVLIGWAMKERSRADRLSGENENLRQQVRGAQRTINILNYNLGKERVEK